MYIPRGGGTLEWTRGWRVNPDIRFERTQNETGTETTARLEGIGAERRSEEEKDERARGAGPERTEPAAEKSDDKNTPRSTCQDAEGIEDSAPLTDNAETPSHVPEGTWLL
ncbi:hypothetical protein NDU88_005086 [Pleurodeles waltl]|uniref:Uncharacterized protein n=1 Tax=Pleurodeles waltl TaxID=8319 RepID=A0AAV7NLQ0_PLEWA|nr:hypothetical protein NDU88_005086 [Pleurodeles waltl]